MNNMNHNIRFSGKYMGICTLNQKPPIDHDNKIIIFGNTPFYFVSSDMWTYSVDRVVPESEFQKSKLAKDHQNVTFCLSKFVENCYMDFCLAEEDEHHKELIRTVKKDAAQIQEVWEGSPAVFFRLYRLIYSVRYSLYHDYRDVSELNYLKALGEHIKQRDNMSRDKLTKRDDDAAILRIGQSLQLESEATVEGICRYIEGVCQNPPKGAENTAFITRLRYLEGISRFAPNLEKAYREEANKAHSEFLKSEFERDKELVIKAVKARIEMWQNA
ncbi:hypothetical protein AB6D66_01425 [Vibrio pomeroyi]|uniref:Uncharacterized protein n=1 Tax=Vibrio pomeroyi TaxID=198832 RepID=A0ABV4MRE0_9VIBR|nr:hypothetical protein [Vibrio atlanticus]MCZ4310215.1 hypothetical protein [Vibrio atlanticus]